MSINFFFNDTATTEIYTLSLHDALPICKRCLGDTLPQPIFTPDGAGLSLGTKKSASSGWAGSILYRSKSATPRSEEHTSELQSRQYLVCRLLLEKKNTSSSCHPPLHLSH